MKNSFTLIESILAVAIAALVLVTIASSFSLGLKVYARLSSDARGEVFDIFDNLASDLENAYISQENDVGFKFLGTSSNLEFVATPRIVSASIDYQNSSFRKIKYSIKQNKQGLRSLICNSKEADSDDSQKGLDVVYTNQLKNVNFYYFDGLNWQKSWNSNKELPVAVRVDLALANSKNRELKLNFSKIIDLPCGYIRETAR